MRGGLLKDGTPDTGCGIKVFDRGVFLDMPRFDHMHRFMPALFQRGVLVYYGAFQHHIGLYPPVADAALRDQAAPMPAPRVTCSFRTTCPCPAR